MKPRQRKNAAPFEAKLQSNMDWLSSRESKSELIRLIWSPASGFPARLLYIGSLYTENSAEAQNLTRLVPFSQSMANAQGYSKKYMR